MASSSNFITYIPQKNLKITDNYLDNQRITEMRSLPLSVTIRFFFSRLINPDFVSFSMILALVAGVPRPERSTSSVISSTPAFSIAESSVSSVKCFGGCVKCSDTSDVTVKLSPSVKASEVISSSSSSLHF